MKKHLQQIRKLFSPAEKKNFLLITLLMTVSGIMEMAGIGLLAVVVTIFLKPDSTSSQQAFEYFSYIFPHTSRKAFIICAISSAAFLLVLKNLFALLIVNIQSRFLRSHQAALSSRVFDCFLKADYRYYITRSADEYNGVIERITRLVDNFFQPALQLLADVIVILCLSMVALLMLPKEAIIVLIAMLATAWGVNRAFNKLNSRLGKERLQLDREENKLRLNVLLGMEQIRISGAEKQFSERFKTSTSNICRRAASLYTLGQIPRLSLEAIALMMICILFSIFILAGISTDQIILLFTVIIAAMARVLPALSRAHYCITHLRQNATLLDELADHLDSIPQEKEYSDSVHPDCSNDIFMKNVTFAYENDNPVLKNFSFCFKSGKMTGVSGRSGTGKSTLINLLAGLFHPAEGKIYAGETDISQNLPYWRKQLGYVPQNVFIFDGPLRENIALGCPPEQIDDKRIAEVLKSAQLAEYAQTPEMMLNSRSGLSGGQRQRIGIARALYRNPKLLILDEATSALDTTTENAFLQVLKDMQGKMTIVVISHRPETIAICDESISLDQTEMSIPDKK